MWNADKTNSVSEAFALLAHHHATDAVLPLLTVLSALMALSSQDLSAKKAA